jgi:hypothetical protein
MKLNHVANRLDPQYFETVAEMLKVKLGFVELRRTERAIWLRQPGTNITSTCSSAAAKLFIATPTSFVHKSRS